jgi:hypothetical protein
MSLRSPLDADDADDLGPLASKLPAPKKKTVKAVKEDPAPPEPPQAEPQEEEPEDKQEGLPEGPPPNEGGQVPQQVPTQVGTPPGTQVGRKEEESEEENKGDALDFSLRGALSDKKDPEQDWVKSGWQAKRYRKAAVDVAVKFKWRGFTDRQDIVDAALAAFLPKEVMDEAREMARRGEL